MSRKFTSLINARAVRNLFFSKLYPAFFLVVLFAAAAFAQTGSSVMIYTYGKQGTDAEAMSHVIRDQIGIGLEKYPCIDQFDDASLGALLGWERARELLGQEPNTELLQNVAGAVGARYVVVVRATTLPNGQTAASVTVMDSQTGQPIAKQDAPPVNPDDAVETADSLAAKILGDLANLFKGQCDPHWTGTVSYSFKYQKSETKTVGGTPGAMESNVVVTSTFSDKFEDTVEAVLQPMSQGVAGAKTMSRVVHRFLHLYESSAARTSDIICRPRGANSYQTKTNGNSRETIDERGQNTATLPVYVYVDKISGKYEISVNYPSLTTERNESRGGVRSGCTNEPFSDSSTGTGSAESDAYTQSGSFKVRGQVDPKTPNVLSGKEEKGDIENGLYTLTWNLRLVEPKKKK